MVMRLLAALYPSFRSPTEPGRKNGDSGNAERVSRCGEEVDRVVVGNGIEVGGSLGTESSGLQSFPDDAQYLGQQRDQSYRTDKIQGLISFHFDCSIISRINSSFRSSFAIRTIQAQGHRLADVLPARHGFTEGGLEFFQAEFLHTA